MVNLQGIKTALRSYLQRLHLLPGRDAFLDILPKGGVGAELGVFQGEFSYHLLQKTAPQKLYLVDPWWEVHGEYFPAWANAYNDGQPLATQTAYARTQEQVRRADGQAVTELVVTDDLAFLRALPDAHLDWAYIDSSHQYAQTRAELQELDRIIKPGGIITGHDWQPDPAHRHHGVYRAVQEFCQASAWKVIEVDRAYTQWAIARV